MLVVSVVSIVPSVGTWQPVKGIANVAGAMMEDIGQPAKKPTSGNIMIMIIIMIIDDGDGNNNLLQDLLFVG